MNPLSDAPSRHLLTLHDMPREWLIALLDRAGPALRSLKMIFEYLPRAYRDGTDMEAREKMHIAATMAGAGSRDRKGGSAKAGAGRPERAGRPC